MPELPEVELSREYLQATALHQEIADVEVLSSGILDGISAARLRKNLTGECFREAVRHGKYLLVRVGEQGWLTLHFGMTGFLAYYKNADQEPDHVRLKVAFANGYRLAYDCGRKLGRIGWTNDCEQFLREQELGPDPLADDFDKADFEDLLDGRRGTIKGLLMNQKALAGIGNVYSDEMLFQAGIHPERKVGDLGDDEREELYRSLRHVLRTTVDRRAGEKGWPEGWLRPVREPDAPCPRCDGRISRLKISGRSSYVCDRHQG